MKKVVAKGAKNGNAKITEEVVGKIRDMSERGMTQALINNIIGVSPSLVSQIVRRKVWAHVLIYFFG